MSKRILLVAGLAAMGIVFPALAQPRPGAAELPIKQIVLFSSGVGYYQREGQVDGSSRIDLQFQMNDINDLLKSLVLEDRGGGEIATINYDNRNPIEQTLKSFALDLTRNPSMGDLLNQARGEQVEILTTVDPKAAVAQSETITGLIVGVEKQRQPVGKDQFIEVGQLNMLTKEGLRGMPLGQVQRVRFLKKGLDDEFRKALEILATGHDKQKKMVSLNFTGKGKRSVKVGYVTESPIWKTSYRLSLSKNDKEKDEFMLQGWAIVENTSDEDWSGVQLGLISGRPISFQMDLYQPLFVPRPVVEPELFASLRPQVYGGDMNGRRSNLARIEAEDFRDAAESAKAEGKSPRKPMQDGQFARGVEKQAALRLLSERKEADRMSFDKNVATAAVSTELGEYFQYLIKQPVSLPRQKSALLPIVNEEIKGTKVSIYNERVHSKFPLLGLQFTNSTALHLSQGPITVFENSTYAGDARIGDLQPKETRLISYAIDLGTEVDPQHKDTEDLLKVKVHKGIVIREFIRKEIKTYKIKNRSEHARTVLVEHPYRPDFKLIAPEKPSERSRDLYRFSVQAEPNKTIELVVEERLPRFTQIALNNSDDETVRVLIRSNASSDKVKAVLEKAMVLKAKVSEVTQIVNKEKLALTVIEQDQDRMRKNMVSVPQTSEAYKRYVKKFDDQETEIEQRRAKIVKLQETAEGHQNAYNAYLGGIDVE